MVFVSWSTFSQSPCTLLAKILTKAYMPSPSPETKKIDPRVPWNKGRAVGIRKPFKIKELRIIRDFLIDQGRLRDAVLLSVAFDTLLRASDVLALRVENIIYDDGTIRELFTIREQKTKKQVEVELLPETRRFLYQWINKAEDGPKLPQDFLFPGKYPGTALSRVHYSRLVKSWASLAHLRSEEFSTHSLRRSRSTEVVLRTGNARAAQLLLNHSSLQMTERYLNIESDEAREIARHVKL